MTKKIIAISIVLVLIFSFCACSSQQQNEENTTENTTEQAVVKVDLQKLYDACVAKMPEMISLDSEMMLNFCGIKAEDCAESYVSICADSLRADEIWLIKVKDVNSVQTIETLAKSRIQAKADESITYSPEQHAIVQKAEIIIQGEYIAVIVSPDVSAITEIINNAF